MKKKMSNKKFLGIWCPIIAFVLVLAIAVNVATSYFRGYVDLFLGGGELVVKTAEGSENWDSEYYKLDYGSAGEIQNAADAMVEKIEAEGVVLLKNNGALPLTGRNVTLLGRDAADPVYGGSGSGSVNLNSVVDFKKGLENAGFTVNEAAYKALRDYAASNKKADIVMDNPSASTYFIGEAPATVYDGIKSSFAQFGDAAIVTFGRGGGEGGDLTQDMKGFDEHYEKGQHQLELNYDEKQALEVAKANFDNVIVIINSSNVMELGVLESDPAIDAVLWIGSPGQTGFNAVGKVLSGAVNPSGRTADVYPADLTQDPAFVNFGDFKYSNLDAKKASGNGYFVQYEEGIYVGYRYYETAAVEGFIDYNQAVTYPFGYGLSYTSFGWEVTDKKTGGVDGEIAVTVKVTNTGNVAGKEVVQLYYAPPYTKGGIEKSSVVLGDFAKTKPLNPGESDTVTLTIAVEDMASYDYKNAGAYVLEAGDYEIRLQTDSHNVKAGVEPIRYNVAKIVVFDGENGRASDKTAATNLFNDVSAMFTDEPQKGYALNMSRADFAGTFPTAPAAADKMANADIVAGYQAYVTADHLNTDTQMPTTGANNGLQLIDLRAADYDSEAWDMLLDELKPADMTSVILNGAYTTFAVTSIGKPATTEYDGPAGISSYMTELSCTAYPSEVVIASTFNTDLARELGVMVGSEGLFNKVNGWYAPAMNVHRSQFGGRNFEYYSEDGVLAGKIAAACVSGAAEKGVYTTLKHFALNEQETHRVDNGVSSWANEQAIREIYLKPFEIAVKTAKATIKHIADESGAVAEKEINACTGVMSSFNRIGAVWAGGSQPLLGGVLRGEWGFEGMVITDFNLYAHMPADQGVMAGSDLMLTYESMKSIDDAASATAVTRLRAAMKNILYTVANSNAMNGIAPGTIISYTKAPWEIGLVIGDVVIGVALCAAVVWVILRTNKHKREEML